MTIDYLLPTDPQADHQRYLENRVIPTIKQLIEENHGQHSIAAELNIRGLRTSTGATWKQPNLCRVLDWFGLKTQVAMQQEQFRQKPRSISDWRNNERSVRL